MHTKSMAEKCGNWDVVLLENESKVGHGALLASPGASSRPFVPKPMKIEDLDGNERPIQERASVLA